MKKKKIKAKQVNIQKPEIKEYYYMLPAKTSVKELSSDLTGVAEESIERWNTLDLMEIMLKEDSLIFQNAMEAFEDPEDLKFIAEHHIQTIYQISYDSRDTSAVKQVLKEIMKKNGGMLCSDTEDFSPIYTSETIDAFE